MANVLLLEPDYKNKYPPLGLMKISSYHKNLGDKVLFAKGRLDESQQKELNWDRVYITTLFTFEWEKTIQTIDYAKSLVSNHDKIFIGGIAATLMPEEIEAETGLKPIIGRLNKTNRYAKTRIGYDDKHIIDDYTPDYEILNDIEYNYPNENAYFGFMTRGCGMDCEFCAVGTLEPKYEPYISIKEKIQKIDEKYGPKKDLLLMDNNALISSCFDKIVKEIKEIGYGKEEIYSSSEKHKIRDGYVDFNQGLDANILAKNEKKAKLLGQLKLKPARIAFDHIEDKDTFKKAVENCVKYGIKDFSNYMLYNADSFEAKGEKHKADSPEDLYKRIKITIQLQGKINKQSDQNEHISIYSFPMKYIPLNAKDRSYVSEPKWNKKYLRAIQVMLLPSQGVGVVSEKFFKKAFGKNLDEFKLNIKMPEKILMSRGKFLPRDGESLKKKKERLENPAVLKKYNFYKEWMKLYKKVQQKEVEEKLINHIKDNSFRHDYFYKIKSDLLKIMYLHYLSPNQFLLLLNKITRDHRKGDINLIYRYCKIDFPWYYKKMIDYICDIKPSSRKLNGFLLIFEKEAAKKIILKWYSSDFENDIILNNLKKTMLHIGKEYYSINKFKAIKRYINYNVLSEKEIVEAKKYIENLDENAITNLLKKHFEDFKKKLKYNNKNEPFYEEIEKTIDVLTAELGKQLSLF
ncbi:MAG: hypothetical protein ACOCQA_00125 [bacterium]